MTNNEYGTKALKITLLVLLLNYIKHLSKVPTRARANDTCVMSAQNTRVMCLHTPLLFNMLEINTSLCDMIFKDLRLVF